MSFRDEVPFPRPRRWLALAFALGAVLTPRSAAAQTVMVQNAAPGAAIDVTFNGSSVATATADQYGDATLSIASNRPDTDVLIYVDACPANVRVQLAGRGLAPAPTLPGCSRVDAGSIFIMRSNTTFVVDIAPSVAVHVAQGPPPPEWLLRGPGSVRKGTMLHGIPGKGLVITAGAGGSAFGSIADKACGNVPECLNTHGGVAFSASADYWFARFVAAEIGYFRPADVTVNGNPTGYTFSSRVQTRVLTLVGKGAVAAGPARIYGLGGWNRHEATYTTTETIAPKTIVVNGVTQTIPGGTQSFGWQTEGWSWVAGGGAEAWVNNWLAIYGEFNIAEIEGSPVSGIGDGVEDQMRLAFFGVRVRLGR